MKKMFIVSAIMLFAVGAMTSCKDSVENGCKCTSTVSYQGYSSSTEQVVEGSDLKREGYKSCSAFAAAVEKEAKAKIQSGAEVSVSCKAK